MSAEGLSGMFGAENTEKRLQWVSESISRAGCSDPIETRKLEDLAGLIYVDARVLTALALDLAAEAASAMGQLATTTMWYLQKASERLSTFD